MTRLMRRFGVGALLALTVCLGVGVAFGASGWIAGSKQYHKPDQRMASVSEETPAFVRVRLGDSGNPEALETAIVTYTPRDGSTLKVTLVGALHIAERAYYQNLNTAFESYEAVLYELVAPPDTRPSAAMKETSDPLSAFQRMLPEILGISFQLNEIDYGAENFIHADLSAEDLLRAGKQRGETAVTLTLGVVRDVLQKADRLSHEPSAKSFDLLTMLTDTVALKRMLAKGLADPSGLESMRTLAPYIIDLRNDAALRVLEREIANGKTNLAIFYGAGHLKDLEQKLARQFDLQRASIDWLPAWDLTRGGSNTTPPIAQLVRLLSE